MKWYRDVRDGFEFDRFRSQTRWNRYPKRRATDHDIRHCDSLILLCAVTGRPFRGPSEKTEPRLTTKAGARRTDHPLRGLGRPHGLGGPIRQLTTASAVPSRQIALATEPDIASRLLDDHRSDLRW